jgi:hypothetical protein
VIDLTHGILTEFAERSRMRIGDDFVGLTIVEPRKPLRAQLSPQALAEERANAAAYMRMYRRKKAMRRKPNEMPELALVPRPVPLAHPMMNDAVLCDELVKLLDPPWGRLPYLRPTRVADICEALGCESHHILRAPLNIALCWDDDGEIVYGRLVAVGDVFGADIRETAARAMKRAA